MTALDTHPHDLPLINDALVIFAVSLVAVYWLHRLGLPTVIGFLLAGVLIGPGALGLVRSQESVSAMAEIGVVLLLFTVGLKLPLRELQRLKLQVLGAGSLQLVLTSAACATVAWTLGFDLRECIFLGFLLSMSSTAVVLKLLEERGESASPPGRLSLGVLLLQDLAIVPLMALTPALGGAQAISALGTAAAVAKSLVVVAAITVAAYLIVPRILRIVVASRVPEVLALSVVLIVLGTAMAASQAGLSLALGAFLAGMVLSDSEYAQHVLSHVAPLRDTFSGLFFVSVGMLVDVGAWGREPLLLVSAALGAIVLKAVVVVVVAAGLGLGARTGVLAGLSLAQVGEFSFVLAQAGSASGILDSVMHQRFLSVSVVTMALTPLGMALAPRFARSLDDAGWIGRRVRARAERQQQASGEPSDAPQSDHVVIVGYGVNGRQVAQALGRHGLPYAILELNPQTARTLREQGEPAHYGDASRDIILKHVNTHRARTLVVGIADPAATRRIVAAARRINPQLKIVVRTRFVAEVEVLRRLGADVVVPEELETAVELVGLALSSLGLPEDVVEADVQQLRSHCYAQLRDPRGMADSGE
jgi:CPA2 family monovalent cation:H+ antiporter-2